MSTTTISPATATESTASDPQRAVIAAEQQRDAATKARQELEAAIKTSQAKMAKLKAEIREAFYDAVSPEDLAEIAKKLVQQAKAGDIVAAKVVLERVLGRVSQAIELSGDLEPMGRIVLTLPDNGREQR
jgi:hypothetical protein